MLRDITIGQFFPGNTIVHNLDPRVKILLVIFFIVMLFVVSNIYSLLAIMGIILLGYKLSKISMKLILKNVKPLLFIIVLTSVINVFSTPGQIIFELGRISVTREGLILSLVLFLRILSMVMISSLLTYTTSPIELAFALERLMMPLSKFKVPVGDLAMMITIALRFVPTLIEETDKIMLAQKSRGAKIDTGNMIQKIKSFVPVVVPLFVSAFRAADDLAVAMECRCYNNATKKTSMKQLKIKKQDVFVVGFIAIFFLIILLINRL